jgi:hypothetical protein
VYVSEVPPEGDLARRLLPAYSVIVTLETST